MKNLREYDLSFAGLKLGKHHFEFPINQKFFESFQVEPDFTACDITAKVLLEKFSSFLNLTIHTSGSISIECDVCREIMQQSVQNEIKLIVKFSTEFDDSDESILTLPLGSHQVNVAQYIYESIWLSVPMKHLHEDCNDEFEAEEEPKEEEIRNPVWNTLKDIQNLN